MFGHPGDDRSSVCLRRWPCGSAGSVGHRRRGRVGYYAVQWAKAAGATVIASTSNSSDEAVCKSVGADQVFNHREPGWSERVKALNGGKPVDRVIDVEFGANLPE